MKNHIVILGAGIIGLASALRLLEEPNNRITIITARISPQTLSDGSPALIVNFYRFLLII